MADNSKTPRPLTEADINMQMARIDGIKGSAGHQLEDPYLRDVLRRQIAGDITGDEARARDTNLERSLERRLVTSGQKKGPVTDRIPGQRAFICSGSGN